MCCCWPTSLAAWPSPELQSHQESCSLYSMSNTKHTLHEETLQEWAQLQADHGLQDWTLEPAPRFITTAGICEYSLQRIRLATWLTVEQARLTLLHETAHALTPGHGHDKVWKAMAISLGHPGTRNHNYETPRRVVKWLLICPKCDRTFPRQRKPAAHLMYLCPDCDRVLEVEAA